MKDIIKEFEDCLRKDLLGRTMSLNQLDLFNQYGLIEFDDNKSNWELTYEGAEIMSEVINSMAKSA
jgi:hypothetical protein